MSDIKFGGAGSNDEWSQMAFPKPPVSTVSLAVTPIEVFDLHGGKVSHGTGFCYKIGEERFLISAWHVFSGRDFFTKRELSKELLIPKHFRFYAPSFKQTGPRFVWEAKSFDLNFDESLSFDEPPVVFGVPVDVAVIRLSIETSKGGAFTVDGANEFDWGIDEEKAPRLTSKVGSDIFVLGYPSSNYSGAKTPLWKRGALASEPTLAIEPKGSFLVDCATGAGMSGGPIIRQISQGVQPSDDGQTYIERNYQKILGVYSGRSQGFGGENLNLGFGWPIDFVHEIIKTEQTLGS